MFKWSHKIQICLLILKQGEFKGLIKVHKQSPQSTYAPSFPAMLKTENSVVNNSLNETREFNREGSLKLESLKTRYFSVNILISYKALLIVGIG